MKEVVGEGLHRSSSEFHQSLKFAQGFIGTEKYVDVKKKRTRERGPPTIVAAQLTNSTRAPRLLVSPPGFHPPPPGSTSPWCPVSRGPSPGSSHPVSQNCLPRLPGFPYPGPTGALPVPSSPSLLGDVGRDRLPDAARTNGVSSAPTTEHTKEIPMGKGRDFVEGELMGKENVVGNGNGLCGEGGGDGVRRD
ncbi:hypothetical protein L6452_22801 [Arctium lappa]|uniref:Uncharacterized protein n=1 Tax=Arctium lappa TaxID=4217 RepID=A0ACB9AZY3_ARCLA|nr:hypothetical protein L6452_22801 [Arctium lappa]